MGGGRRPCSPARFYNFSVVIRFLPYNSILLSLCPPDVNICQCFILWDIIIADLCMFDELRFHNELISV